VDEGIERVLYTHWVVYRRVWRPRGNECVTFFPSGSINVRNGSNQHARIRLIPSLNVDREPAFGVEFCTLSCFLVACGTIN
jgi:hypothetical protein